MALPPEDFPPANFPPQITARSGQMIVSYEYSPSDEKDMGLEIEWAVITRSLYFNWGATPAGPGEHGLAASTQYVLPFWPTAIAGSPIEKGVVYVAGWTERGRTRILKLALSAPSLALSMSSTGQVSYSLVHGQVTSVREIYDAATSEVGFISNLLLNRGDVNEIFVHRFPGGQADVLSLDSGHRVPLLTSDSTGAPFVGLTIDAPYKWAASVENSDLGYVYLLDQTGDPLLPGEARRLFYRDTDKDGDIDQAMNLTSQQYAALTVFDPAKVVPGP
jgi:hypothetical protein